MSGGSFEYLSSRFPDEVNDLANQVQRMADALLKEGLPYCAERTQRVVHALTLVFTEANALEEVWHAKEWRDSGDWGRASVRQAAVALGELLPPCPHVDKRLCYGTRKGHPRVPAQRFLSCEECGEQFDAPEVGP